MRTHEHRTHSIKEMFELAAWSYLRPSQLKHDTNNSDQKFVGLGLLQSFLATKQGGRAGDCAATELLNARHKLG